MSIYQEYKASTNQFESWILKTSTLKGLPNELNQLKNHVDDILVNSQTLLQKDCFIPDLTRALYHGKRAIEARKRVHLGKVHDQPKNVSPEEYHQYVQANAQHAYCIELLQECHDKLSVIATKAAAKQAADQAARKHNIPEKSVEHDVAEQFAGLSVEATPKEEEEERTPWKSQKIDAVGLDEIDLQYGDIRLRLICFFLEMVELEEYLIQTWKRVKATEISLPSATVVMNFAVRKIKMIDSELSVIYPSYTNAASFFVALKTFLSPMEWSWISNHLTFHRLENTMEFYNDFAVSLVNANVSFRDDDESRIFYRSRGHDREGKVYNECYLTTLASDKDKHAVREFLYAEVGVLLNCLLRLKNNRCKGDYKKFMHHFHVNSGHLVAAHFIREFLDFFESKEQTTTLLFQTLCWVRSVQFLEDDQKLFMLRTAYLYRSFIRQRSTNFQINQELFNKVKADLPPDDPKQKLLDTLVIVRKQNIFEENCLYGIDCWSAHQNNPFLVGAYFLDCSFLDHICCTNVMVYSPIHQYIPFFYTQFKENGILEQEIPFIEQFLKVVNDSYCRKNKRPCGFYDLENSETYLNFTRKYYTEPIGDRTSVPKSIRKPLFRPDEVSPLYCAIAKDDFRCSSLHAESLFTREGFDELILLTDSQVSGYLSLDFCKYFIAFHELVHYLHGCAPLIREWYTKDCLTYDDDFSFWARRILVGFLANFLTIPASERTELDSARVKEFFSKLAEFCAINMKDIEDLGEKTFVVPQGRSWNEIYRMTFGDCFLYGMDFIFRPVPPPQTLEYYDKLIKNTLTALTVYQGELQILEVRQKTRAYFLRNVLAMLACEQHKNFSSFLMLTFTDPKFRDEDFAEFVFVTYGAWLNMFLRDKTQPNSKCFPRLLFEVCRKGVSWALDILISTMFYECVHVKDAENGDTIFHVLAKNGFSFLINYLISFGFSPSPRDLDGERSQVCLNNEGRIFTYYLKDEAAKEHFQRDFDVRQAKTPPRKTLVSPSVDGSETEEMIIAKNLEKDVREDAICQAEKELKRKGKKITGSESLIKEIAKEDEEKAKLAEQELLTMIEKIKTKKTQEDEGTKKNRKKK
jgi:aromatic ring-cleaving dioxygenase